MYRALFFDCISEDNNAVEVKSLIAISATHFKVKSQFLALPIYAYSKSHSKSLTKCSCF